MPLKLRSVSELRSLYADGEGPTFSSAVSQIRLLLGLKLHPRERRRFRIRRELAVGHLSGEGIEIGALHMPLRVPPGAHVRYVDHIDTEALRTRTPELSLLHFNPVDVIDDGERLTTISSSSLDFLIANHVIEHCVNALATLETWLRVVRPGGVLFITVPDRSNPFDRLRPLTALDHLRRDYELRVSWTEREHFEEVARLTEQVPEERVPARVEEMKEVALNIHQHVWSAETFREMLDYARDELRFPFHIVELRPSVQEFIAVLRKTDDIAPPAPGRRMASRRPDRP